MPDWDYNFLELKKEILFEIVLASNFLEIKKLLDYACSKISHDISGMRPEDLNKVNQSDKF